MLTYGALTIIQVVLNKVIGYNVLDLQVKWITRTQDWTKVENTRDLDK